jgi:enterochelin esterase family protein
MVPLMLPSGSGAGPAIDGTDVTFALPDPTGRLQEARLLQEIGLPGPLRLARVASGWSLRLARPAVDRMEYLYEVEDHNGNRVTITDPTNPHRVGGAFGDKSELSFPTYGPPVWLNWPEGQYDETDLAVAVPALGAELTGILMTAGPLAKGEPAPLVVAHDGPEYAALGGLARYLNVAVARRVLPPLRAALLGPGDRNVWYSANPAYAAGLAEAIGTDWAGLAPATLRIGVGVSLGGLAMLHAHMRAPGLLDAMLLQSASFFTPRLDPQERSFGGFRAVTAFVAEIHGAATRDRPAEHPVPVVLTCGTVEENLANNRRMATSLRRLGYPARLVERRDAHNYTAWRDALHPHFTSLLTQLVADRAA